MSSSISSSCCEIDDGIETGLSIAKHVAAELRPRAAKLVSDRDLAMLIREAVRTVLPQEIPKFEIHGSYVVESIAEEHSGFVVQRLMEQGYLRRSKADGCYVISTKIVEAEADKSANKATEIAQEAGTDGSATKPKNRPGRKVKRPKGIVAAHRATRLAINPGETLAESMADWNSSHEHDQFNSDDTYGKQARSQKPQCPPRKKRKQ